MRSHTASFTRRAAKRRLRSGDRREVVSTRRLWSGAIHSCQRTPRASSWTPCSSRYSPTATRQSTRCASRLSRFSASTSRAAPGAGARRPTPPRTGSHSTPDTPACATMRWASSPRKASTPAAQGRKTKARPSASGMRDAADGLGPRPSGRHAGAAVEDRKRDRHRRSRVPPVAMRVREDHALRAATSRGHALDDGDRKQAAPAGEDSRAETPARAGATDAEAASTARHSSCRRR